MSQEKQITLPVMGMTCANCVASVERNTKKVDGITAANVNFASEKVTFTYDPALVKPQAVTADVIARIERAGYEVPVAETELSLLGMTCTNCANTIERRLNKVDGVLEATVNYANEKAIVKYAAGAVTRPELVAAVRKAGYDVVETSADSDEPEDAEADARQAEIDHQKKRLIVGLIFTIPLFTLSMARDFGLLGLVVARQLGQLVLLCPGDSRAVLRGLGLLRRRVQKPAQRQCQYGCAGGDGIVCGLPVQRRRAAGLDGWLNGARPSCLF